MSLARIRDEFRVPAYPGRQVHYDEYVGTITGCEDDYLKVNFGGAYIYIHPDDLDWSTP